MMELGACFLAPSDGDWPRLVARFQRARFAVAKLHIPPGFGTPEAVATQVIAAGATTVILRTEDCDFTPKTTRAALARFLPIVAAHPEVHWWLELGNEQNLCGQDAWATRFWLLTAARELADLRWAGLRLIASLPTTLPGARTVLTRQDDGYVPDLVDALGCHVYGWNQLSDTGGGDWLRILDHVLTQTSVPVWLSEYGIDDKATSQDMKAGRCIDWLERQPSRVEGATAWVLAQGSRFPQYELTDQAADVYAARLRGDPVAHTQQQGAATVTQTIDPRAPVAPIAGARYFPETGHNLNGEFRAYWEANGGLMQFGYPITEEFTEDGRTVQYTERQRLELHPENAPAYRVLLGLLGTEAYERRYGHG